MDGSLLTRLEAARFLRINLKTFIKLIRAKRIPTCLVGTRKVLIRREDLDTFLAKASAASIE